MKQSHIRIIDTKRRRSWKSRLLDRTLLPNGEWRWNPFLETEHSVCLVEIVKPLNLAFEKLARQMTRGAMFIREFIEKWEELSEEKPTSDPGQAQEVSE